MKPSRLIAWVTFSAFAGCADLSGSQFRDDDQLVCEADDAPIDITTTTIELWPPNHEMRAITLAECAEVVACDPDWSAEILWVSSDEPVDGQHDGDCDEDDEDDEDEDDEDEDEDEDDEDEDDETTTTGDDGDGETGGTDTGADDLPLDDDDDDDGDDDDDDDDGDDDGEDEEEDEDDDDDATSSEDIAFVGPDGVELRAERDGSGNGRVYTIGFVVRDTVGNELESSCTVTVPHDQGKKGDAIDDGEVYRVEP